MYFVRRWSSVGMYKSLFWSIVFIVFWDYQRTQIFEDTKWCFFFRFFLKFCKLRSEALQRQFLIFNVEKKGIKNKSIFNIRSAVPRWNSNFAHWDIFLVNAKQYAIYRKEKRENLLFSIKFYEASNFMQRFVA